MFNNKDEDELLEFVQHAAKHLGFMDEKGKWIDYTKNKPREIIIDKKEW